MDLTKYDIIKSIKKWDRNSLEELLNEVSLLIRDTSDTIEIELTYDQFKGSGDCFVAKVDSNTKKVLKQIKEERTVTMSKYKGKKYYILVDGYYLTCETGTKAQDYRQYIKVDNGVIVSL